MTRLNATERAGSSSRSLAECGATTHNRPLEGRYPENSGLEVRSSSVPSFFYIGAPRAGSTWLYTNLQRHPVVWVP